MRLNKYLSDVGVCSRRQADRMVEENRIKVNGMPAVLGQQVDECDEITVDGKPIKKENEKVILAFNKPRGIECTTASKNPDNIVDYIDYPRRVYPVGRLDKDSEGLILLTNDGSIVNLILKGSQYKEKEYIVSVDKKITDDFIKRMSEGVEILDTVTRPCKVKRISDNSFNIILTQGLNRQIRRMCEALGYRVQKLKRIRIMNVTVEGIKKGTYKEISFDELGIPANQDSKE